MTLEGSCRCGAVSYAVESSAPYPYQLCYCTACRKSGGAGYAINLLADAATLRVEGRSSVGVFRAVIDSEPYSGAEGGCRRHFCRDCGSMLWIHDPDWPDLLHPFASSVDTDLPAPPARVHLMLDFKAPWVEPDIGPDDQTFPRYPEQSIEDWHKSRGLWIT
jgi:hypothetical protein